MKSSLKSLLNTTWKVGLGVIGLAVLGIAILIATAWYQSRYGRADWNDKTLSSNIRVHGFKNNCVRIWDYNTASYITPKLRWVSDTPRRDSITVYSDTYGYRGYLNCHSGKIVIPAEKYGFRHAWQFSEGRAFVVLDDKDSLSVINYSGKIIARNVAPYIKGYDYIFEGGVCLLNVNGKTGILGLDGSWVVKPKYQSIDTPNTSGYRIAINEEGYWLFNEQLELVFSEPYSYMEFAVGRTEGTGTLYRSKNHVKQLVNYDGSVVEPFVIDGTYNLRYPIRYNGADEDEFVLDPDLVVYIVDNWEGLMNKHTGRIIIPAEFTDFQMISKDLIKAALGHGYNKEAIILDRRGRVVKQQLK